MRKKILAFVFSLGLLMALAVPAFGSGTASAHDLVPGGVPNGPNCHGQQVKNHVKTIPGGMKGTAAFHSLSVKENQKIIKTDCQQGNLAP